jgi:hypothetical protein
MLHEWTGLERDEAPQKKTPLPALGKQNTAHELGFMIP